MKILILAPHPDDEVIGCSSVLLGNSGQHEISVLYFFDVTKARKEEIELVASEINFTPLYWEGGERITYLPLLELLEGMDYVFCPSAYDSHPQHLEINQVYHRYLEYTSGPTPHSLYYTTELAHRRGKALASKAKRHLMNLYSSQRCLWEHDASYYLFEHISNRDEVDYENDLVSGDSLFEFRNINYVPLDN